VNRLLFSASVVAPRADRFDMTKLASDLRRSDPGARAKVLLIGPLPPPTAGVEALTHALLAHLRRGPWEARCLDTQKRRVSVAGRGRLSLVNLSYAARDLSGLLWELGRHRPAVVHTSFSSTTTGALRDALVVALCRLLRVPVVAHLHGGDFDRLLAHGPAPVARACRGALRAADRVVVLSTYWKELIEGAFGELRCSVVANGSDDLSRHARVHRRAGPVRILHVGAQGRRKGVPELLGAVERLRREGHDLRLTLLGAEEWIGEGERIARTIRCLGLTPIVTQTGQLEGDDRIPHFETADIFCLPSHHEGAPVALLEAMSAGLPVVVSSVGAMPEMVGRGGKLVAPGDIDALVDALRPLVLGRAMRGDWGRRNRADWERRFTLERHLAGVAAVLSECVPKH